MLKKLRSPLGCLLVSGLLFVGTMVGLFILALRHRGEPYIGEVVLSDGMHRLRLLKAQNGPFDYTWKPPLFQSYLPMPGPHVPPIQIHLSGLVRHQEIPGHTFLFRTVDARGRFTIPPGSWPEIEFIESTGFVFKDEIGMPDYPHWGTYALTRSALPRRDKDLVIHIQDRLKPTAKPVDMTIPNPFYRDQYPEWQADTLPIEKTKGPLTVRLAACAYQHSRIFPEFSAISSDPSWASPSFHHTLEDATGNQGEVLSPFEPVWKLKTKVYRSASAEFPQDVRAVLENLPILAPGTVKALDQKLQIGGFEFRVLCVAGAGIVRESNGQFTAKPLEDPAKDQLFLSGSVNGQRFKEATLSSPFVWIEMMKKLPHDQRVEVQFSRDGQRAACSLGHIHSGDGTGSRTFIVAEMPVAPGTTEVDLTIAISRPEEFDFIITPPAAARVELTKPEPEK